MNVPDSPASAPLYEEDVLSSRPIRLEQLQQMRAYVGALAGGSPAGVAPGDKFPAGSTEDLRQSFRALLGFPPPGFLARGTARFDRVAEDALAVYFRCWVKVTPQMETYGLYLVPKAAPKPAPLVIALHGGGGFPELATFQGGSNYHDLVRGAVAQGYVVFAPLTVMYPYRDRDHGTPIPENVREELDAGLLRHGLRLMGVEVAKITRALDVLLERPEIDRNRVAMIGLSYGGFYTLYAAALDGRITAAVASCSFCDRGPADPAAHEQLHETRILRGHELVRLISPRALQVQNGRTDSIFPIDDVRRAVALSRGHYAAALAERFDVKEFDGPHEFRGELAWPFLRKFL